MPTVEEVYHQYWGKVGGVGRLRRTFSLFAEFWEMLLEVSQGLKAPLVNKEDAILSKLLWNRQGSHKARHDVIEMLKRDEDLDRDHLRERATALGLHDLLAELEKDMREAREQGLEPRHT
jgi:hypothetical protein